MAINTDSSITTNGTTTAFDYAGGAGGNVTPHPDVVYVSDMVYGSDGL